VVGFCVERAACWIANIFFWGKVLFFIGRQLELGLSLLKPPFLYVAFFGLKTLIPYCLN